MNRFQKFVDTFKNCQIKYDLKLTDACTRSQNCAVRIGKNAWQKHLRWQVCPCSGKHSYECFDHFCTVDNISCNSLMSMDSDNLFLFKKC